MAKLLSVRNTYCFKMICSTLMTSTRSEIPNALMLPVLDKSWDGQMLNNLRIAVTPSYGYGSNTYKNNKSSFCTSLAGDPKRLNTCQDIRAEVLEKWNRRPKPDIHKEWMKNMIYI